MKELTIKEKAEAYDKAYKIAENIHRFSSDPAEIKRMEQIFPKLKEREDEEIRKEIIEQINLLKSATLSDLKVNQFNSWINWLEKQGQNSINKVEPKFEVGYWIVNNDSDCIYQIKSIKDDKYCLWPLYSKIEGFLKITDVDNDCHLWTIQDAKNGDILAFDDSIIVMFEDLYNESTFHSYCYIGDDNVFHTSKDDWWNGKGFHPATEEQRDKLKKAITKAGYKTS